MIYKNNRQASAFYYAERAIAYVYKGTMLVWQAIRSCFGNGYWDNSKPWDNNDGWMN